MNNCPEGYRILQLHEMLQKGDKGTYLNGSRGPLSHISSYWNVIAGVGYPVRKYSHNEQLIRKIFLTKKGNRHVEKII